MHLLDDITTLINKRNKSGLEKLHIKEFIFSQNMTHVNHSTSMESSFNYSTNIEYPVTYGTIMESPITQSTIMESPDTK